jgi:hypothetical protein
MTGACANQERGSFKPGPSQSMHPFPLIHALNVRLSLHQRPTDLAVASPFPILVLTIAIERLSSFVYRQSQKRIHSLNVILFHSLLW